MGFKYHKIHAPSSIVAGIYSHADCNGKLIILINNSLFKVLLEIEQNKRIEQFNFYLNCIFQHLKSKTVPFLNLVKVSKGEQVNKSNLSKFSKSHLHLVYKGGLSPLGYYEKFNSTKNKITICSGEAAGDVKFIDVDFWVER